MDEKKMLKELKTLMRHNILKKIIYYKLAELKDIISASPDNYLNELKRFVPKKTITTHHIGEKIEFELILFGDTIWIPWVPDSDFSAYEYISEYVIDFISETETEINMPQMWNNITLGEKTYDLIFTKDSEIHFTCTIVEKDGIVQNVKRSNIWKDNRFNKKTDIIKTLIQYMFENENFYNHVVNDFQYKWKPLIDGQGISNAQ